MSESLADKILAHANSTKRTMVGTGECFDLANEALSKANAKTAADFGKVTENADYVWGTEVPLAAIMPGDVLQYRNYALTIATETETKLTLPDGSKIEYSQTSERTLTRPHHTAIATSSPGGGAVKVIEQNVDRGSGTQERLVDTGEIYIMSQPNRQSTTRPNVVIDMTWGEKVKKLFKDPTEKKAVDDMVKRNRGKPATATVTTTHTIKMSGTLKAYRPQAKSKKK